MVSRPSQERDRIGSRDRGACLVWPGTQDRLAKTSGPSDCRCGPAGRPGYNLRGSLGPGPQPGFFSAEPPKHKRGSFRNTALSLANASGFFGNVPLTSTGPLWPVQAGSHRFWDRVGAVLKPVRRKENQALFENVGQASSLATAVNILRLEKTLKNLVARLCLATDGPQGSASLPAGRAANAVCTQAEPGNGMFTAVVLACPFTY